MVLKVLGYKLRNVIFHVFLDVIIHFGQTFVSEIIIPLNDFDSFSWFSVLLNPRRNFLVAGPGGDEIFEFVRRNASESKKQVVDRTIKVVFAKRVC